MIQHSQPAADSVPRQLTDYAGAMNDDGLYPVSISLASRRVVVVGGGSVAARRVPVLADAGAIVEVISPRVETRIEDLAARGHITWTRRVYQQGDLDGAWYVIAATDDAQVNKTIVAHASATQTWCVRADIAKEGTAMTPAVVREHNVSVAVHSGGDHRRSVQVRDFIATALQDFTPATGNATAPSHGSVTLVGAGPGDPDLLTLAAYKALHSADVVVADRLAPLQPLDDLPPHIKIIDASKIPFGKSMPQETINQHLIHHARAGKHVVRYKGGDNFVFGRGYEEALACAAENIPVTIVPGVSSSLSVPATASVPVTHRGIAHEFTVISGHLPPGHPNSHVNWEALAQLHGTLVILMGVKNSGHIATELIRSGKDPHTPCAAISEGFSTAQTTARCTLAELHATIIEHNITAPAVIVIGQVAGLDVVNWAT